MLQVNIDNFGQNSPQRRDSLVPFLQAMGVLICYIRANERVAELGTMGLDDNHKRKLSLGPAYGASDTDSAD